MDRYCQERGIRVLNDFAAVRTFLLNCEETVSPGVVSQVTERFDASAFFVAWGGVYSQLQRMDRLIVVPNGLHLGTFQLADGSAWPSGSGRRIPLTVRSPTSEDQCCEAFAGRVRYGVAVRSHAGAYQPFA